MQELKDFIAGTIRRGKPVWDADKKAYREAKYFNVIVYERDQDGNPIQIGTRDIKVKGKTESVPKYKIATMLRLPEITLLKVASGEAKSCLMFWRPRQ